MLRTTTAFCGDSNLHLLFSLPFAPIGRRNAFCSGHIALAMGDLVCQAFDPRLLRAPFVISVMPLADWLFGRARTWVDRDPRSPRYRRVQLYGRGESQRTVVYAAGMRVEGRRLDELRDGFDREEARFAAGERRFSAVGDNCSSLISELLARAGIVDRAPGDFVPALFFRRFVERLRRGRADGRVDGPIRLSKIALHDERAFRLHRLCVGLWGFDPQANMDRWMDRLRPCGDREP